MVMYWTIGLGQRLGQVWDYRIGYRDMVRYGTIGLGTETWSGMGL